MILICGLILATSCCETCEMYEQVSITFNDGTTKTYKTYSSSSLKNGSITLYKQDGGKIYLTNCKEVEITQIVKRNNNNY